jgi:hypothetical protein
MRLSEFKSAIGNVARPNLFEARLTGWQNVRGFLSLSAIGANIDDTFTFRCEAAEHPGRVITTNDDLSMGGGPVKMGADVMYADINLTIICSEDMKERFFFEAWMDNVIGAVGTGDAGLVGFYDNYAMNTTLEVTALNSANRPIYKSTMYYIYPTTITPMSASWEDVNTYQRFQVTMNYRFYTVTRYV